MSAADHAIPEQVTLLPNGSAAAWVIGPDGARWPWVLVPSGDDDPGCRCRSCCPHEQLGGLDRCWRPRHDGKPCRQPDPTGHGCAWHRAEETA